MTRQYGKRIVHRFALQNNGRWNVLWATKVLEEEEKGKKKGFGGGLGKEMLCERIRRERGITSTSRSDKLNASGINREGPTES